MTIPKILLDDQIKVAETSLEAEKKRLKDHQQWLQDAQQQIEIWEAILGSLKALKGP